MPGENPHRIHQGHPGGPQRVQAHRQLRASDQDDAGASRNQRAGHGEQARDHARPFVHLDRQNGLRHSPLVAIVGQHPLDRRAGQSVLVDPLFDGSDRRQQPHPTAMPVLGDQRVKRQFHHVHDRRTHPALNLGKSGVRRVARDGDVRHARIDQQPGRGTDRFRVAAPPVLRERSHPLRHVRIREADDLEMVLVLPGGSGLDDELLEIHACQRAHPAHDADPEGYARERVPKQRCDLLVGHSSAVPRWPGRGRARPSPKRTSSRPGIASAPAPACQRPRVRFPCARIRAGAVDKAATVRRRCRR